MKMTRAQTQALLRTVADDLLTLAAKIEVGEAPPPRALRTSLARLEGVGAWLRVRTGQERARVHGRLGRPRSTPAKVEARIRDLYRAGVGKGAIAQQLGVGVSTVMRVLAGR